MAMIMTMNNFICMLPNLLYDYGALEPCISKTIMELHHLKHHATYVNNANIVLNEFHVNQLSNFNDLTTYINNLNKEKKQFFINNFGGHSNHSLFWKLLTPIKNEPSLFLINLLNEKYGSFENFKKQFIEMAMSHFGSGWTWLQYTSNKNSIEIVNYTNQNTPIFENNVPLLGLDLWEHAYYLQYQNRKKEYFESFFNIINWNFVEQLYKNKNTPLYL